MDTEAETKSANLTDTQRKLLQVVDDATHKLDSEERRAILDALFSALYQDKCPVESNIKTILDSDSELALQFVGDEYVIGRFDLSLWSDSVVLMHIASGETLTELVENYIAMSFFEPESPKGK